MIFRRYLLPAALAIRTLTGMAQPITDAQALDAGRAFEKAVNNGYAWPTDHFINPDSLLENTRQQSHFLKDSATLAGFRSTFVPGMTSGNFSRQIMATIRNGNYRLLREFDKRGTKHLLFRMFGDGGLNYHDYQLVRAKDSIKASDLYVYSVDEWTSTQLARLADMMGQSSNMIGDVQIIVKMRQQFEKQEYAAVKQGYEQLDKKYRQSKAVQLIYIHACEHIDLGLYQKALEDYSTTFPDAASSYLMMLDLYYMQKQYEKGLDAINKLDKVVGDDPFLNYYRGNIYRLMNKPAEATACYEKVYQYDPTLKQNVLKLISQYAAAEQKEKAQKIIAAYMQTPAYHVGDLNTVYDQYPGLK
jgi:tetratricopeptide (TPR) repeat protein